MTVFGVTEGVSGLKSRYYDASFRLFSASIPFVLLLIQLLAPPAPSTRISLRTCSFVRLYRSRYACSPVVVIEGFKTL